MKLRRVNALMAKEFVQILRDPSSLLIAFVLPMILLFLFGYGVSLDAKQIKISVVLNDSGAEANSLASAFFANPYFTAHFTHNIKPAENDILSGRSRGIVVIDSNFSSSLHSGPRQATVQVIADGSETNTANYVQNYSQGIISSWLVQQKLRLSQTMKSGATLIPRFWFNPELQSKDSLVPGAIAIIMAVIGTLLTALVVAREWERGTMEAMMATPVTIAEVIIGKLIPYFILGLTAMLISVIAAIFLFKVPFHGSFPALIATSVAFLLAALGQGLLISTATKNQFVAAQVAMVSGFLPAFLLSGFIFEIASMPLPIRILTHIIPARYLVTNLQTLFLVGDVWSLLLPNIAVLLLLATILFAITAKKTAKRLR